jgi:hypothetical protein
MAARAVLWAMDWPAVWALLTRADHAIYLEQARRVLAGGPLYPAFELAGPFRPEQLPEVYPPVTVWGLFVPFALLPMPLWWLVPIGVTAAVVWHHRPSPWAWVAILLLLALPDSWTVIAVGNPSLFVMAGLALATIWPAWALLALAKPTLAPLALLGVRSRWWWVGLVAGLGLAAVTLPAWQDYATVLRNYQAGVGIPREWPLLLIPLIAWIERSSDQRKHAAGVVGGAGPDEGDGLARRQRLIGEVLHT